MYVPKKKVEYVDWIH